MKNKNHIVEVLIHPTIWLHLPWKQLLNVCNCTHNRFHQEVMGAMERGTRDQDIKTDKKTKSNATRRTPTHNPSVSPYNSDIDSEIATLFD